MNSYSIDHIAKILNGELIKASGSKISYLLIDSRKVLFPRESLFFALRGTRSDGHNYIPELYKQGIRNFITEEFPQNIGDYPRANFIKVPNSFDALQQLVTFHRSQFKVPIIGITGSNGKTIVKEWIYQCLSPLLHIVRSPKSYNSQIGVPLSAWLLTEDAQLGVFEAGISMPSEMNRLQKILKPNIGIFTNIGDAHQENFASIEQKVNEKANLFKNSKTIICHSENTLVKNTLQKNLSAKQKLFSWGKQMDDNLLITEVGIKENGTHIAATYQNQPLNISIPFIDKASIENAIHVWSLMLILDVPQDHIESSLADLENVAMRLELNEGINNCTIINDSYNSDLESLHIALDFLSLQNQHPLKLLIISDIAQSGYSSSSLYQKVASMVKQKHIDRLIGIGPDIVEHQEKFELRKDFFPNTDEFLEKYPLSRISNMTILLKGARTFAFEKISAKLSKISHLTEFEIDLEGIEYNLNHFKNLLNPKTGIIAMVKAFSYGSGTHEIANICQYQNVAALAVAFADEGAELRRDGIRIPILVMNPDENHLQQIIDNNLEPQINNFKALQLFDKVAGDMGQNDYPIHLKLDTGMNRSGFTQDEINELLVQIQKLEHTQIKTIFSHLSSADEPSLDNFTEEQIQLFINLFEKIEESVPYKIKKHILNSAGIERFSKYQFDYVRIGIGMYGVSAIKYPLAQVGTFKSTIAQIKWVNPGDTVGYGRKGAINKKTLIATVPMGYADGLRRSLGNGVGHFWIKGKKAPIVGNVCMDICMIDVTHIKVKIGDQVELFGKNQSIYDIAEWMDTIPYEVLTSISRRVKRTYITK